MRINRAMGMRKAALALVLVALAPTLYAAEEKAAEEEHSSDANWKSWHAENEVENLGSLQRGARNFMNYCSGCHSLKYERYSRLGTDLGIPEDLLEKFIVPANAKPADYVVAPMPKADAEAWFGKAPPDLSLIARSRGADYLFQLFMTYYVDPTRPTGANNLRLDGIAMPHVLSDLEGLKRAVFKTEESKGENGQVVTKKVFDHFEVVTPGKLSHEEYTAFVRDTVNFLDYVGEPTQVARRSLGIWVILFLLVFTWLAWSLKKEYWKNVH
jgi:ubiquinol-cytochrome c reductase cytochrome c1 subunit